MHSLPHALVAMVLITPLVAADVTDIPGLADVSVGLCVHLGATDGRLECELVANGRRLVQGLALDRAAVQAARQTIRDEGLHPLASVRDVHDFERLPYADNLVNLLIADLDAMGDDAPTRDEMLRVLRPAGVLFLKTAGRWVTSIKPRPAWIDEWTHFDYGPEGNAVSRDARAGPPKQLQWVSGVQPIVLGGNPAGFVGSTGMRLTGGRAFSEWTSGARSDRASNLGCWDAFNGLPLWHNRSPYWGSRRTFHITAVDDRLYLFGPADGPLTALDAATGRIVATYDAAGTMPGNPGFAAFRVCADLLIVTNAKTLYAIDHRDGAVRWTYRDGDGRSLFFPTASPTSRRVYVIASDVTQDRKIEHRWPNVPARAVVCLDLSDGRLLWRCTEVDGKHIGQAIGHGRYVGLFGAGGIGAGKNPFTGCLRASDGKLLWTGTFPTEWNRAGYAMLWRDSVMYYADPWKIFQLDPATGVETHVYGGSYNGRCMRFVATDDWLMYSLVTYVDRDFNGAIQSITRSACANSPFPANGMIYFTPTACRCTTMLRGHIALTPEPLLDPIADAERLERLQTPCDTSAGRFRMIDSLIARQWALQNDFPHTETDPVVIGDRMLVAVVHEHRMQCRRSDGDVIWSFTAGGRISSPPVVCGPVCVFGCHDGCVYALRLSDGTCLWRFTAAPYERMVIAHGQLETSWPVYGVTMHEGRLWASAGLHPELGGGIYLYALDPATGQLLRKGRLAKSPAQIPGTERIDRRIVPHSALNWTLHSDGDRLTLPAGHEKTFTFDPDAADTELKRQLETHPDPPRE